jgi:Ca2+-binding RTX toxin-like protein
MIKSFDNTISNRVFKPLTGFLIVFTLGLAFGYAVPGWGAKPTCPGHPSCNDPDDSIQLGAGNDVWPGTSDDNSGDDTVLGGDGDDTISGGQGNDDLNGQSGDDLLYGEDGADDLDGGDGYDQLFGGAGSDHLRIDFSGVIIDGVELGDYADGGISQNENGKEHRDYLHLTHLDVVEVMYDDPGTGAAGAYLGFYKQKGKNGGTKKIAGEFRNILFIYGTNGADYFVGNDLENEIWGYDGEDIMYGMGGNDSLRGGGETGGDYLNGGDGDDSITGLGGDDYIVGGTGNDKIWIKESHENDAMEDFTQGEDRLFLYNTDVCFPDLQISVVDWHGDGSNDDTRIYFGEKNYNASITLLDTPELVLTAADFDFEVDRVTAGCL